MSPVPFLCPGKEEALGLPQWCGCCELVPLTCSSSESHQPGCQASTCWASSRADCSSILLCLLSRRCHDAFSFCCIPSPSHVFSSFLLCSLGNPLLHYIAWNAIFWNCLLRSKCYDILICRTTWRLVSPFYEKCPCFEMSYLFFHKFRSCNETVNFVVFYVLTSEKDLHQSSCKPRAQSITTGRSRGLNSQVNCLIMGPQDVSFPVEMCCMYREQLHHKLLERLS